MSLGWLLLGESDEVVERRNETRRPVLGVPHVCEVRVVRVQQRGDGELVLRQQGRVLVRVQRRRQCSVDLCKCTSSVTYLLDN
jgi:Lon protease-like protein